MKVYVTGAAAGLAPGDDRLGDCNKWHGVCLLALGVMRWRALARAGVIAGTETTAGQRRRHFMEA